MERIRKEAGMEERKKEKRKDRKLDIQGVCPVIRNSFVNIK